MAAATRRWCAGMARPRGRRPGAAVCAVPLARHGAETGRAVVLRPRQGRAAVGPRRAGVHRSGRWGLGPVLLGYDHPVVRKALRRHARVPAVTTLNHQAEVEVAELLVEMIPSAELVVFGKNGSDACTAAARVARAVTGRSIILSSGFHGIARLVHRGRLPVRRPGAELRRVREELRIQRRGRAGEAGRGACGGCGRRDAGPGEPRGAARRLPPGGTTHRRRTRGDLDIRRGAHRLSPSPRRRADAVRRHAGSHLRRQSPGERTPAERAGGSQRPHAGRRPDLLRVDVPARERGARGGQCVPAVLSRSRRRRRGGKERGDTPEPVQ